MATGLRLVIIVLLSFGPALGVVGSRERRSSTLSASPVRSNGALVTDAAVNRTCKSRVEIYGYDCEEHTVTTEDGYILSLQRIPNGRRQGRLSRGSKTPVLLQHGLFMDGITWLLNSPDESLGYILADNGYDVWIPNSRGTVYSLGHTSLSSNDSAYWDWSWDELAAYDLPATLEYIHEQTNQEKIHFVGHSLGTLMALAYLCQPNLSNMMRSVILLSPIAYMDQMPSPLGRVAADAFFAEAYYWLGVHEFDTNSEAVHNLLATLCKVPGINCYDMMGIFTGKNCCLNSSTIQIYQDHELQVTSTKNMIHLAQMIRRGTITKYDYGNSDENIEHYGEPRPPAYNISAIPNELPLFIGYGRLDELSDVKDVEHLLDTLKFHDVDKLTLHYVNSYAHADFSMGVNAKQMVYNSIMEFFRIH